MSRRALLIVLVFIVALPAYSQITRLRGSVGSAAPGEFMLNQGGLVTGLSTITFDSSGNVFATSFNGSDVDGNNTHGFFDNPGGRTCSPADNDGEIFMDSTVTADEIFFCNDSDNKMQIIHLDGATTTVVLPGAIKAKNITYIDVDEGDITVANNRIISDVATQDYTIKIAVMRGSALGNRLWIGGGPTEFYSGTVSGDEGIEIFDVGDDHSGTFVPPANFAANYSYDLPIGSGFVSLHKSVIGTENHTVALADQHGSTFFCAVAAGCTFDLPGLEQDSELCFYDNDGTVGITINPDDNDTIQLPDGTLQAAGVSMVSTTANATGDFMCLKSQNSIARWFSMHSRGTWTAGS